MCTPKARARLSEGLAGGSLLSRVCCSILYDLTELEGASRFKKGETERTEKKIANVEKWFSKLDVDLGTFLSYFS